MRGFAGTVACYLVLALAPASAGAARGIAVEVVTRPDAPSALPPALASELARLGFRSGEELERRLRRLHSWPAAEIDPQVRSTAGRLVERGYQSYIRGEFDQAVADCERGLERLLRHPGSVARDHELREHVFLAYVVLAMAENRRENPERVRRAIRALIRSFPRRAPSLRRFGPEGREIYEAEARAFERAGTAKLEINAADDVLVYINERFAGAGGVSEELPPGTYRVYLERAGEPSRVHEVFLRAGERVALDLSFRLDRALVTGGGRVRLVAEAPASPAATELARALGESLSLRRLILVAPVREGERAFLLGTYLDVGGGKVLRQARVALRAGGSDGGLSREKAHIFADYLVRGRRGPGIVPLGGAADRPPNGRPARGSKARRWAPALLTGGVAAAAAGGVLLVAGLARGCGGEQRAARCRRAVGVTEIGAASVGLGLAAAGAGVYLWWGRGEAEDRASSSSAPGRLGAGVAWEF